MAAAPVSSATEHVAEAILAEFVCVGEMNDERDPSYFPTVHGSPREIAEALAAAGLLCTPPERAVIDAAIAETAAEVACNALTRSVTAREFDRRIGVRDAAREARRVAVAEHNQHRGPG